LRHPGYFLAEISGDGSRPLCKKVGMSVNGSEIDRLCEHAINFLLSGQGDARRLAASLVMSRPDRSPLEVIFVLSFSAAAIEEVLASPESRAHSVDAWRIAGLLGVDLHMMQISGRSNSSCRDLLHYWQTVDPYFLAGPSPDSSA
jgi:hypothetical protein